MRRNADAVARAYIPFVEKGLFCRQSQNSDNEGSVRPRCSGQQSPPARDCAHTLYRAAASTSRYFSGARPRCCTRCFCPGVKSQARKPPFPRVRWKLTSYMAMKDRRGKHGYWCLPGVRERWPQADVSSSILSCQGKRHVGASYQPILRTACSVRNRGPYDLNTVLYCR